MSWIPPFPVKDTTGYQISYTRDGNTTTININGSSTNTHLLTGLLSREMYTVSVVALSQDLPSNATVLQIMLSEQEITFLTIIIIILQ